MNALRRGFESLGFAQVATFLGSGNVVFETRAKDIEALERKIEHTLKRTLGYRVPVFIRTQAELKEIASLNPFADSESLGAALNIILLSEVPDERTTVKLLALRTETDSFRVCGREVYWCRRKRPGRSLFSTVPLAKVLREPFTIRSNNTIKRLLQKWP